MGVHDLNKLFNSCKTEPIAKPHTTIIYDGSNILVQTLNSELTKLKNSGYVIGAWGSLNLNIMTQIMDLIQNTVRSIVEQVRDRFKRTELRQVYFVVDGTREPTYNITNDMIMNKRYLILLIQLV